MPATSRPMQCEGFTLVESLLVMTIMAILLSLLLGATRSIRENMHLASAGQLLADEIGVARQLASARNATIFVYLYRVPAISPVGYRAFQLWRCAPPNGENDTASMVPVDKPYFLPADVAISEDATHNSALLAKLQAQQTKPPTLVNLPPTLLGADYAAFAVQPSGKLALDGDLTTANALAGCCLTVVPARFGKQSATPANFVTLQINPNTGTSLAYRP